MDGSRLLLMERLAILCCVSFWRHRVCTSFLGQPEAFENVSRLVPRCLPSREWRYTMSRRPPRRCVGYRRHQSLPSSPSLVYFVSPIAYRRWQFIRERQDVLRIHFCYITFSCGLLCACMLLGLFSHLVASSR